MENNDVFHTLFLFLKKYGMIDRKEAIRVS